MSFSSESPPVHAHDGQQTAPAPVVQLSPGRVFALILVLGLANFGVLMASTTPQFISLALKLSVIAPESATTQLSLLLGVGVALQIIVLILVGRLSDYTTARIGMRRPWLIGGVALITIGSILLGVADSLPVLWVGYIVLSMGITSCVACLYATIPDQIPEQRRGLATGVIGATSVLGTMVGLFIVQLIPGSAFFVYVFPAVCALVGVTLFVIVLNDRRLSESQGLTLAKVLGAFTLNRRVSPSLVWFVPSIALVNTALAAVVSYAYYILAYDFGVAEADLPTLTFYLQLVLNGIAFVVSLIIGSLSDRIGRRKPFYAMAAAVFIAGVLVLAFGGTLFAAYLGFALVGIGQGLVMATYLSIAVDAMGDLSTSARDINLIAGAYTLPYALLPIFAPLLLGADGTNFTVLLISAAAITLLALVFLPKIRVR